MNSPVITQPTAEPDSDLPEDICRIPPECRDAELRRLAKQCPTKQEQEQQEAEAKARAAELGIPYP